MHLLRGIYAFSSNSSCSLVRDERVNTALMDDVMESKQIPRQWLTDDLVKILGKVAE
jgi:hypothetical protein